MEPSDQISFGKSFAAAVAVAVIARCLTQLWLEHLNRKHVLAHSEKVPEAFRGTVDEATYAKSVQYTLVNGRFEQVEIVFDCAVLLFVLFSGILPWVYQAWQSSLGNSAWSMAGFLFAANLGLTLPALPFSYYHQFRIEERFGFNTTTRRLWWMDRLKGLALGAMLGYPLVLLLLKLVVWTGNAWWIWGWGSLLGFQLLMLVLAPILILPLFNKFTPLPEGSLRERLLDLAERTHFKAQTIQVMDGSRRSRHSNAFFTGFGGFRKIVLFDTLIEQLTEVELEAVLAHEVGHYRKGHIPKRLLISAVLSLFGFFLLFVLTQQAWFYEAFGFRAGSMVPALLLFGLLAGVAGFWFAPLSNWWSRRHEFQADAFAASAMREGASLTSALRKLNEKNLSNLTPHPVYSRFYYSHPTLLERENALRSAVQPA
jgi:STE24 endopeptidase